jgi:hypothetical protein
MALQLIVNEPFGKYAKGDRITVEAEIVQILGTPQSTHVLPITVDDAPPAKPTNPRAPD